MSAMIIGIGNDILNIGRIEKLLKKFGSSFEKRFFREEELNSADDLHAKACHYAKKFAAKEAFSKALGIGFRKGLRFIDIFIVNNELGKPELKVLGKAKDLLDDLSNDKEVFIHISLTDDYPMASAIIILETC